MSGLIAGPPGGTTGTTPDIGALPVPPEAVALSSGSTAAVLTVPWRAFTALSGADRSTLVITLICTALFAAGFVDPSNAGIWNGTALTLLLIGLIGTKSLPDHIAALLFFALATSIAQIPPQVAFAGFYTGATWLIFAGAVICSAITQTGAARRFVDLALGRFSSGYGGLIGAILVLDLILAALIPSTAARVLMLMPVMVACAPRLGLVPGGRGYNGVILAAACGSYLPLAGILTSSNRNVAFVGTVQSLYGVEIGYADYLRWNFPVLTVLVALLTFAAIMLRYRQPVAAARRIERKKTAGHAERLVLLAVLCALALWSTDFLHGIRPAWIALCVAVFCVLGPCPELRAPDKLSFGVLIMFAALIGMGSVIAHTGLSTALGGAMVKLLPLGTGTSTASTVLNLFSISVIGLVISVVGTNLGGPVVLATLAQPVADATGWPLDNVLVIMMPAMSVCVIVFQTPILLVAARMANIPFREISIFLLLTTIPMLLVILPLQFLWLTFLGVIP